LIKEREDHYNLESPVHGVQRLQREDAKLVWKDSLTRNQAQQQGFMKEEENLKLNPWVK